MMFEQDWEMEWNAGARSYCKDSRGLCEFVLAYAQPSTPALERLFNGPLFIEPPWQRAPAENIQRDMHGYLTARRRHRVDERGIPIYVNKSAYREYNATQTKLRRADELPSETAHRRELDATRARFRRSVESIEETVQRLDQDRRRTAERRAIKKLKEKDEQALSRYWLTLLAVL